MVREYMYLMREDVVFVYPRDPSNFSKYMKKILSYDSFDYMIVRQTDKNRINTYQSDEEEEEEEEMDWRTKLKMAEIE